MTKNIEPPSFGESERPRVLVEATEWANREVLMGHLREAGYDLVGCAGPEGCDLRCTLVAEGECSAVEDADVVVQSMRHGDPRNREVLLAIRSRYEATPVVVEIPAPQASVMEADLAGTHVVAYPAALSQIKAAVRRALEENQ